MGLPASRNFAQYRAAYAERAPILGNMAYDDGLCDLTGRDDCAEVKEVPAENVAHGEPPRQRYSNGIKKYLWLVKAMGVLGALEEGPAGINTMRKSLAHTNLSGGEPAFAGGELWYRSNSEVWITGGSGRYPPADHRELDAIADSFRKSGYTVCNCGWDGESGPARFFRGTEKWLASNDE